MNPEGCFDSHNWLRAMYMSCHFKTLEYALKSFCCGAGCQLRDRPPPADNDADERIRGRRSSASFLRLQTADDAAMTSKKLYLKVKRISAYRASVRCQISKHLRTRREPLTSQSRTIGFSLSST